MTLSEVKRFLRRNAPELDTETNLIRKAAVEFCEHATNRSLRVTYTVTDLACEWPTSGRYQFLRQPTKSITSIKYYDLSDVQQTVTSTDYRLHQSTDAAAYLEFVEQTFTYPAVYDRDDAIEYIYVAGYASADAVPSAAKSAILLTAELLAGDIDPRDMMHKTRARDDLLAIVNPGMYA